MIIANSALRSRWISTISYLTRDRGVIVKYTVMTKPMKTLELHYLMINLFMNRYSLFFEKSIWQKLSSVMKYNYTLLHSFSSKGFLSMI